MYKQELKEEAIWAQMKERVEGHSKTQTIAVMNKTIKMSKHRKTKEMMGPLKTQKLLLCT
jgi:phosphoenolpyruvate synthase/pyruvate phosphate dikinase